MLRSRIPTAPAPDYRNGVCKLVLETPLPVDEVLRRLHGLKERNLRINDKRVRAPRYGGTIQDRKFWLGEWYTYGRYSTAPPLFGELEPMERGTRITIIGRLIEIQSRALAVAVSICGPVLGFLIISVIITNRSVVAFLVTTLAIIWLAAVLREQRKTYPAKFSRQVMRLARWLGACALVHGPANVEKIETDPRAIVVFVHDMASAIRAAQPKMRIHGIGVLKKMLFEGEKTAEAVGAAVEKRDLSKLDLLPPADIMRDIARLVLVEDGSPTGRLLLIVDPFELYDDSHVARDFGAARLRPADLADIRKYVVAGGPPPRGKSERGG